MTLFELMQKYDSVKVRAKYPYAHKFVKEVYPYYFDPLRDKPLRIIEIGVGEGGAIRAMQEYLPKAELIGVDYDRRPNHNGLEIEYGDQGDLDFMRSVANKYKFFDIVIDDASHKLEDQLTTFDALFPALVSGGLYFIEDVMTGRHQRGRARIFEHIKDNWLTEEVLNINAPSRFQKIAFYKAIVMAQKA